MPPKVNTTTNRIIYILNYCGIVCTSVHDFLIIVSILVSLVLAVYLYVSSYTAFQPIKTNLIEPYKQSLSDSAQFSDDFLSPSEQALVVSDSTSVVRNLDDQGFINYMVDIRTHIVLITFGSLIKIFDINSDVLHISTLLGLAVNDGSQKLDSIVKKGIRVVFEECFYDISPPHDINLARATLENLRIDPQSRDLLNRIIDGKEAERKKFESELPVTPEEAASGRASAAAAAEEAEVVDESTIIPASEDEVGMWSRWTDSFRGFVGKTKDAAVNAAKIGTEAVSDFGSATINKAQEYGSAIKVVVTGIDRGNCMKTQFKEIADDEKRKYDDFFAKLRKQSNKIKTAQSYSWTLAMSGNSCLFFSLGMLIYYRNSIKERREAEERNQDREDRIRDRALLAELMRNRNGELRNGGPLAIGDVERNAQGRGPLAIGDVERNAQGRGPLMANPWNNPNLPFRRVGTTPSGREAQQGRRQIANANAENANQDEKKEDIGGGRTRRRRRKTKKRRRPIKRRQTRKLRRNTKRRRM